MTAMNVTELSSPAERYERVIARMNPGGASSIEAIQNSLQDPARAAKCTWVTSPTGKPHLGYFVPLLKFGDFVEAGVKIQIVLLDTYSFLDNVDYPMEQVLHRMEFYRQSFIAGLECLGIDSSSIEFVQESSYESPQFTRDLWRLCTLVSAETVRNSWDRAVHPEKVSPLMCPLLQLLSEEYLDCDFEFGGEDQKSIFDLIEQFGPQMGHRSRGHMTNPMLPNLTGKKMSATHADVTKIMLLNSAEEIMQKMLSTPWQVDASKNAFLMIIRDILIPLGELHSRPTARVKKGWKNPAVDERAPPGTLFSAVMSNQSIMYFDTYDEIRQALGDGRLEIDELKASVATAVVNLLAPARVMAETNEIWQAASEGGYPTVKSVKK